LHHDIVEPTRSKTSRTSHGQVVDGLGKAIISGEFPVGSVLPGDAELAQRFTVSRTVLRESMKTLTAKGLIVPRARVGTKVTDRNLWNMFDSDVLSWHFDSGVSEEFLLHLYDMRLAFEPFAAGLAAERATSEDIALLTRLAQEMANPDHNTETLAFADLRFHLAIAGISRNPFMRSVGSLIEAALVGIFKLSSPSAGGRNFEVVAQNHMDIVDAIAARDRTAAQAGMERVILIGRDNARSLVWHASPSE